MKIDDRIESLVRAALDAAVHRDIDRFEVALRAFVDEETTIRGVELALTIIAFVLYEVHDGKPSATQNEKLAERISGQEQWLGITVAEVADILAATTGGSAARLAGSPDRYAVVGLVVAANLLASASRPKNGEWWFNYLDKVEAAIEAAP